MPRFLIAILILALVLAIVGMVWLNARQHSKLVDETPDDLSDRDSIPRAILAPPVFFAEQLQSHDRSN